METMVERPGEFPLGGNNEDNMDDEGGFFDDDMMSRGGRGDIRSHLDDLAQRHPEFASQLRGPAWGEEMWAPGGSEDEGAAAAASSSSQASSTSDPRQEQEQSDEPGPLRGRPRNSNLPQHGLRNTVPDMGQRQADELKEEAARGQRSWSAPPDNRSQQRFVSRININPVNPETEAPGAGAGAGDAGQQPAHAQAPDNQGKPPPVPKQPQQPPQQPKTTGNVRHIPIFVEGRDEPILPKNVDADSEPASYQQHFTSQTQHQFHPQNKPFPQQKRPFQSPQNNPPQHKQPNRSFNTSPKPFQQPTMQPQQPQANVPTDARSKSPEPPRPRVVNDPISRVQAIQREVSALKEQVEKYSGSSRQEKEYVFLDEMLTRNLIKLDDIETEGKENIRVARKDAIRSIQQCINILEGKVPLPREPDQPMEESTTETGNSAGSGETPSEATAVGGVSAETTTLMEVEEKAESAAAPTQTEEDKPKD